MTSAGRRINILLKLNKMVTYKTYITIKRNFQLFRLAKPIIMQVYRHFMGLSMAHCQLQFIDYPINHNNKLQININIKIYINKAGLL